MKIQGKILQYFVVTSIAWAYYACILPLVFFIPFYGWGWDEIVKWWIIGSPIEFIIAYPLARILIKTDKSITEYCEKLGK